MLVSLYLDYYIFSPRHMLDVGEKCDAKCEAVLFCSFLFFSPFSRSILDFHSLSNKIKCGIKVRVRGCVNEVMERSGKLLFCGKQSDFFGMAFSVFH